MRHFTERSEFSSALDSLRGEGVTVGFVPTMGALHRGHISLVECARRECSVVAVSIFVNPTQFNDKDDLRNYPRMENQDLLMLEKAGVDIVFMPTVDQIYPEPDTRIFDFGAIERVMEGATRPGHFNGVAQVVSRLFDIVEPDKVYFGEKDFQQIAIIKAMVSQLGYSVGIVSCPIIREADGLAMSSRNMLLNEAQRVAAPQIYATLQQAVKMKSKHSPSQIEQWVVSQIDSNPELKTIYFNIVDSQTLQCINNWSETSAAHGCIAVQAGNVRLIDNISFLCI